MKIKRILSVLLLCLMLSGCKKEVIPEPSPRPDVYTQTAAYIGRKVFTLEQLIPYISLSADNLIAQSGAESFDWASDNGEVASYVKQDALEIIRLYTALEKKASELGITLTEDEEKSLETWHDDAVSALGSEEEYEKYLESTLISEETYIYIYKMNLIYNHLFEYHYGPEGIAKPTQEEADNWCEENELYHIDHIFLSCVDNEGNALDDEMVQYQSELIQKLMEMVNAGEDMAELARQYSTGGELKDQYFYLSETTEDFAASLKELKIGQISGVVESQYGFHIIRRKNADVDYLVENYPQVVTGHFNELISRWTEAVNISTTEIYDEFDVSELFSGD
ncbi:MAG: peptidylprolyl isomerase [Oscillospiraceae bacterium]|nr:peptidylprolyl isomerase [Oscillospiraceae bacterium]